MHVILGFWFDIAADRFAFLHFREQGSLTSTYPLPRRQLGLNILPIKRQLSN